MDKISRKRKTVKPTKCPNPLFEQWLEEWRVEAANKNADLQYCYKNALNSLRKYPLKLNSGAECLILKNFGRHLCAKIDKKLLDYQQSNAESNQISIEPQIPEVTLPSPRRNNVSKGCKRKPESPSSSAIRSGPSSPRKKKAYIPSARSGAFAILAAFLQHKKSAPDEEFLRKTELIDKAQEFCDTSFTRSENGNHYTAWSSMSTLIKKGFVSKTGNPAKYFLTKEGENLAATLSYERETSPLSSLFRQNDGFSPSKNGSPSKFPSSMSSMEYLSCTSPLKSPISSRFTGGSSSTQLLSNNLSFSPSKVIYKSTTEDIDFIDLTDGDDVESKLIKDPSPSKNSATTSSCSNIENPVSISSSETDSYEQLIFVPGEFEIILLVDIRETSGKTKNPMSDDTIRALTNLKTKFETRQLSVGDFVWIARDQCGKELLLPYIVERKRMDDLGSSIKDGRFHEQKFRLRQCGLENVTYLVEKYGKETGFGLPINTLNQAIVNTQLVDKFYVKITNKHSHSMTYLSVLTRQLIDLFKEKTLISCRKNDLPPFNINEDIASLMTFVEFSKSSVKSKNLKIHEMFIKQLVQLKGLSLEKAVVISQKYPTPRHLISALKNSVNPEMLLSNLPYGLTNRNIGPTISKTIYKLYTSEKLE